MLLCVYTHSYEGPDFAIGVALKSVAALPINKDRVVLELCANNPTAVHIHIHIY